MPGDVSKKKLAQLEAAIKAKSEGNFEEAERVLQQVIEENPQFAAAYNNLGTVYFANEQWHKALGAFQAAIANQADYLDAYYNLGLTYKKLDNYQAAFVVFDSILKISNEHMGAHFQIGCLLMLRQQYKDAINHFEAILEKHPKHLESCINLANCHLRSGEFDRARSRYLTAINDSPDDAVLYYNLGVIHFQLGEVDAAISYYSQAIAVRPAYFEAYNNLAVAWLVKQDRSKALSAFMQAARIQPENKATAYSIDSLTGKQADSAPPAIYISSLFDAYAEHYDIHMQRALKYSLPNQFLELLGKKLNMSGKQWDVLDLGCGTGLCGEKIKPYSRLLHGVDLSEKMLIRSREKAIYDELICSDMTDFLKSNQKFYDLIMAGDALVYQGDLTMLFELIAKSLKSRGLLLFNTEISADKPFVQLRSGRFAHSMDYLQALAGKSQLTFLYKEKVILREQSGEAVEGYLCLLASGRG